ncbi:hypothetical protein IWX47DRAFT_594429 [Phyllosticta citricarpa]
MQDTRPQSRSSSSTARSSTTNDAQLRQRDETDLTRPQQAGRWWSCTVAQWKLLHLMQDVKSLRSYHHAGQIMEDESRSVAAGPCSLCHQHNRECRVYNLHEAAVFGTKCAGCWIGNRPCSLMSIKDKRSPLVADESVAPGPGAVLRSAAGTVSDPMSTRMEGLEHEVVYLRSIIRELAEKEDMLERLKRLQIDNEGLGNVVSEMAWDITALKGLWHKNQDLKKTVSTLSDEVEKLRCIRDENDSHGGVIAKLVDEISALKSHQKENGSLKNIVSALVDDVNKVKRELKALEDGSNAGELEPMDDSY